MITLIRILSYILSNNKPECQSIPKKLGSLKKSFLLSLRSKEGAVHFSDQMILRSPRRFAFAKLRVMT